MPKGYLSICLVSFGLLVASITASAGNRAIILEGVYNTRDLGGLSTTDGHMIRPRLLIRSGEIDHITPKGKSKLGELGATAIIDLRTTKEASANPAEWTGGTGPRRYNFPLLENESELIDEMRRKIQSGTAESEWMDQSFHDVFGDIPTDYPASIRKVFDILLEQPIGEGVLFHCSGGKDRTGVVTALLLTALGVPRDQIERDFLMSNDLINADAKSVEMAKKINEAKGTNMTAEAVWPSLGVRPAYLNFLYETLELKYGSVVNYLEQELGLSDSEIASLRAKYLQ